LNAILFLLLPILTFSPIFSKAGNRYVRPQDFPDIPADVRAQLVQSGCLIPQDLETTVPHNVVSAELARKGQRDWVAYCSVDGKSHLVMMWGGAAKCSGDPFGLEDPVPDDAIYANADPAQLSRMPPHGSFWKLTVVPQAQVIARQRSGIPNKPLLDSASHNALQRSSIAGANGVYCTNGKWRELWYVD
jgi:hypothetical protein